MIMGSVERFQGAVSGHIIGPPSLISRSLVHISFYPPTDLPTGIALLRGIIVYFFFLLTYSKAANVSSMSPKKASLLNHLLSTPTFSVSAEKHDIVIPRVLFTKFRSFGNEGRRGDN